MPRASLLPNRSSSSYSKLQKSNSSLSSSATSSRFPPLPLFIFSLFSLSVGIGGTFYSFTAYRRSHPLPVIFRCGHSHDTFRALYSSSSSISRPGGEHRPKLLGLVGVQTRFGSENRRAALRSTWFPSDPDQLLRLEQATGLAFRFVIGRSKDAKKMKDLETEVDKHKDFMLIDVEEENLKLPYKTLAFLRAAFKLFDADYYVKAEDVIYLRPDRLATLLAKERTHPLTYIGCMKKGPVINDPTLKWYEKSGNLLGNEYFMHASGPIYVLSAQVVTSLASAKNDSLRMFNNEDVTIGSWMLSMNVHHEDSRALCDPRCTPTSIAVWDFPKCPGLCNPVSQMRELHKTSMCSKSPTLPPEER